MANSRIHMPSSGGGLVRYFEDEYKSKIVVKPLHVIIICIAVAIAIIFLHIYG